MAETVKQTWVGPFDGELPDGTLVRRGETVEVPKGTASTSAHWAAPNSRAAQAARPREDGEK